MGSKRNHLAIVSICSVGISASDIVVTLCTRFLFGMGVRGVGVPPTPSLFCLPFPLELPRRCSALAASICNIVRNYMHTSWRYIDIHSSQGASSGPQLNSFTVSIVSFHTPKVSSSRVRRPPTDFASSCKICEGGSSHEF